MQQIDYNLRPGHPLNKEAARALGLKWSEADRAYIRTDGTIPPGYEGEEDSRWNLEPLTEAQAVHALK